MLLFQSSDILVSDYLKIPVMIYSFIGLVFLIAAGSVALYFLSRLRALRAARITAAPNDMANRYRPMLRLLSGDDFSFVSADPKLLHQLRAQRRRLFRGYLSCLTKDYGRLLEGVRLAMVLARVDRPDLVRLLARSRFLFAIALCRVEFRLALHAAGIGKVDITGLVDALDALRGQVAAFSQSPVTTLVSVIK